MIIDYNPMVINDTMSGKQIGLFFFSIQSRLGGDAMVQSSRISVSSSSQQYEWSSSHVSATWVDNFFSFFLPKLSLSTLVREHGTNDRSRSMFASSRRQSSGVIAQLMNTTWDVIGHIFHSHSFIHSLDWHIVSFSFLFKPF